MNLSIDIISRDGTYNPYLGAWLRRHNLPPGIVVGTYGPVTARNQSVRAFLHGAETHLCQIDADMVPDDDTEAILTAPGDLVYCNAPSRKGTPNHSGDGDFGIACGRMSRELLLAVPGPWFHIPLNDDGTQSTMCECDYFRRKAEVAGYEAKMVGTCGHLVPMVAKIDGGGVKFRWPQ